MVATETAVTGIVWLNGRPFYGMVENLSPGRCRLRLSQEQWRSLSLNDGQRVALRGGATSGMFTLQAVYSLDGCTWGHFERG